MKPIQYILHVDIQYSGATSQEEHHLARLFLANIDGQKITLSLDGTMDDMVHVTWRRLVDPGSPSTFVTTSRFSADLIKELTNALVRDACTRSMETLPHVRMPKVTSVVLKTGDTGRLGNVKK